MDRFPTSPLVVSAERVCAAAVEERGLTLLGCALAGGKGRPILRLYIEGEEGTTLDQCVSVHRAVTDILDAEDLFPGAWTLEVSSPGEKRPLFRTQHLNQALNARIKVRLRAGVDGRRRATGELLSVEQDSASLRLEDGTEFTFPLNDIEDAHCVPEIEEPGKGRKK